MVKTRSQDGDSKGKELDVEDPLESRLSRLENMLAERGKMIKQLADMVEASSRSTAGKIEFPKSIDKMASQLQLQEELQSSNVLLEEKSKPEAQEENPKLENHEGWEQMETLEVEGDVEKGQEVQSMEKICTAHQVFDKMSLEVQSKRRQVKCHKSWRFKFKQRKQQRGKPRSAHKLIYKGILMIDSEDHLSSSMVKEIGIEISSERWLSNSIGCELETGETVNDEYRVPSDSDLIMNDIEKDKERLKGKKRRKSLKSWRFKFKIQVFSDFDIASWAGLEIFGCETKKQTLLIVKLANHVWKPGGFVHPKIQLDWLERALEILQVGNNGAETVGAEQLKRRRQQKFHKTRQFKFKQQPRRNMVYTTCLRILKRGKEQGRSTQVKLFKNWKFKYKQKHPLRILPCNAQHGFRGRKKSLCKLRPRQHLCVLEILERSMVPSLLSSVSVSRGMLHPKESDFIEWSELLFGAYLRRDNIQQKIRKEKGCQSRKFKFKMDFKPAGTSYLKHHRECGICAQIRGVKKQSKLLLLSLCPSFVCRAMLRVTVKQRKHPKSWSFKYKQHINFFLRCVGELQEL